MKLELLSQRPTRLSTLPTIVKGQTCASFDDAVNAARKHAQTVQFGHRIKDRNNSRFIYAALETNASVNPHQHGQEGRTNYCH